MKKKISAINQKRLRVAGELALELRNKAGYSHRGKFAIEFELDQSTVGRLENGKDITLVTLFNICDSLKVTPHEFFSAVDERIKKEGK